MTITVPNLPYSFSPAPLTSPKRGFMYKNAYDAFFYNSDTGVSEQIVDINYPGYHTYNGMTLASVGTVATATVPKLSITSLTSANNLATATTAAAHNLNTGDLVTVYDAAGTPFTISALTQVAGVATALFTGTYTVGTTVYITGALPLDYDGAKIVTACTAGVSFSYALASTLVSTPATLLSPAVPATDTTPAIPAVPISSTLVPHIAVSTLTQASGLATATTAAPHGFATGEVVTINGVTAPTKLADAPDHTVLYFANLAVVPVTTINGFPAAGGIPALRLGFVADPGIPIGTLVTISGSPYAPYNGTFPVVYTGSIFDFQGNFFAIIVNVPTTSGSYGPNIVSVKRVYSLYNGSQVITVTGLSTFTYSIGGSAEATAAGTITATADYTPYNGLQQVTVTGPNIFTYFIAGVPPTTAAGGTITYQQPHGFGFGDTAVISGALPVAYNGTYVITAVSDIAFTYTFAGGTSPATGTILVTGGQVTAPGIVSLDSYYVVLSTKGKLYVSDSGYPTRWSGLSFNPVQQEVGAGVALGRSSNYVVALKEWSTEVFYDAGNSTGSPLSPVLSAFTGVGCAAGDSIADLDDQLFWVSQTHQKGRAVHQMKGLGQELASTPDVDRILSLSNLSTVYAYGVRVAGHGFYVLTLADLNLTLVLDTTTKHWAIWSSFSPAAPIAISSVTIASGIATVVTTTAHGLRDGDPAEIAGCTPVTGTVNGRQGVTYLTATSYRFFTSATGTVTLASPTSTGYTETYFKYTKYINALGKDLVQHESNGTLYEMTESSFSDAGNPINSIMRTPIADGGTSDRKFFGAIEVIGNKVDDTAYLRYSGNDYATSVNYRPVPLNALQSRILRCGSDNRRSFELRYWGSNAFQASALELDVEAEGQPMQRG